MFKKYFVQSQYYPNVVFLIDTVSPKYQAEHQTECRVCRADTWLCTRVDT